MDQGMFLLRAREIWENKELTLIGPTASPVVDGRHFFQGPLIYYFLIGLMLISKWNPITASGWLIVLNLIGVYFIWKMSKKAAILATFVPVSIYFSKFIWNPNILLILAPIYWYLVSKRRYWLMGIMAGIMLQFHFQVGLAILGTTAFLILKKTKWQEILFFFTGISIGYLPLILFDLRNNLYNTRTILLWLRSGGDEKVAPQIYYFLVWIPLVYVGATKLVERLKIKNWIWGVIVVVCLTWVWQTRETKDMPKDFNYKKLEQTGDIVLADNPSDFNIVNKLSGDTRFYPLRYLLTIQGRVPMEVDKYPDAKTLYVVTDQESILNDSVWEISSFKPRNIENSWNLGENIKLLKLGK